MALDTTDSTNTCTRIIESILEGHAQQQCVVRAANRVRALQIDGGGFLGYVMFAALKVLESRSPNGRLCYAFDVIYGTSTGAIIGAALAAGASVAEVEALYAQHGDHIFTQVNPWWMPWRKLTRPFYDSNRVLDPLSALLKRYGVTYMADLKTRFVAVTVDTCKRENVFQKSWKPEYSFLEVTECVARSFAALFYFGQRIDKKRLTCFGDGATGALNCALIFSYFEAQAIAIANERTPATSNGVDTDAKLPPVYDVDFYSFGCGIVLIL
jgi:patatin-like phospholipase/acyl hydrolase